MGKKNKTPRQIYIRYLPAEVDAKIDSISKTTGLGRVGAVKLLLARAIEKEAVK